MSDPQDLSAATPVPAPEPAAPVIDGPVLAEAPEVPAVAAGEAAVDSPTPEVVVDGDTGLTAALAAEGSAGESATEPVAQATDDAADLATDLAADKAARVPELSPAACGARLAELFPALFPPPSSPASNAGPTVKPIKLRIQADLQARAPGVFTKRTLGLFLGRYTTTTAYLKALVQSPHRYDLDGQPAGEIDEVHRAAAVTELARRREMNEARRAAERAAARASRGPSERRPGRGPGAEAAMQPGDVSVDAAATATGVAADGSSAAIEGTPRRHDRRDGARPPRGPRPQPGAGSPQATHTGGRPPAQGGAGGEAAGRGPRGGDRNSGPRPSGDSPAPRGDRRPGAGPDRQRGPQERREGRHDDRRPHAGSPRPDRRGPPDGRPHDPSAPAPGVREHAAPVEARIEFADPAQRERAQLLRQFDSSPLTKANFCALKRMSEAELDAILAQARAERGPVAGPRPDTRPDTRPGGPGPRRPR